jgi:drug/metabolite transporter (DMT)-like permease
MAVFLMFCAGVFVSLSNLFMRKSIDRGGTTKGFLIFQMAMAFCVALLLNPIRTGDFSFNGPIGALGILAGMILAAMLFSLGRALEKGPPGLTFSILNASTVMPAVIMALLFGAARGFPYTSWHAMGSLLVLFGLFWAGKGLQGLQDRKGWLVFCFSMFALHILLLVLFQWRALLLNMPRPEEITSLFTAEQIKSQWFMPFMFLAAAIVQLGMFLGYEKRWPHGMEVVYGVLGGAANGLCTYFMIWSTEVATPLENAVIFPIFSVVTIILSNLWGQKLYQEQVNWRACQVCAFGLVVGTVDWKAVAAAMGF